MDAGHYDLRGGLLIHLGTGNFDARAGEGGSALDQLQLEDTVELLVKINHDHFLDDNFQFDELARSLQTNFRTVIRQWFTLASSRDAILVAVTAHSGKS